MSQSSSKIFSLVLPAYNDLQLFKGAFESVVQQRGVDLEIVVVDDSESDVIANYVQPLAKTPEILSSPAASLKIRYSRSAEKKGAVHNWNRGLSLAAGEYIILLHHDERLDSDDYLLKVSAALDNADVVVSTVTVSTVDGNTYRLSPQWIKRVFVRFPVLLFASNLIGPCACIAFRSGAIKYLLDERLHWLVDVEWYYRLLAGRNRTFLDECNVNSVHGHRGQITVQIDVASEEDRDLSLLRQKYAHSISVKASLWMYGNVFHNKRINSLLKKIVKR